jgi:anti-sigma regulatory factor (Ser/Thr protein kinase)
MRRTRTFPAVAQSVPAARRFALGALADSPASTLEAVELMVSELATNCIRHEHSSFDIAILRTASEIRIEVTDSGGGTPTMRSPGPHEPSGRGLQIVDMLSERWGVVPKTPSGKTVWFTVDVSAPAQSSAERASRQRPLDQSAPMTGRPPVAHRRVPSSGGPSNCGRRSHRDERAPSVLCKARRRCPKQPAAVADRSLCAGAAGSTTIAS